MDIEKVWSILSGKIDTEGLPQLEPGVPCGHPGCASHLSHPCEWCGRYAAGKSNGPDVDIAKRYIETLGIDDSLIYRCLSLSRKNDWTWEQTLTFMVIELQKQNRVQLEKLKQYLVTRPCKFP